MLASRSLSVSPAVLGLCAAVLLGGCERTSGWFGRGGDEIQSIEPEGGYTPQFIDTRPLVAQVTDLRTDPTLGGLIIRAEGLPDTQEYWNADLVQVDDGETSGTLRYEFRLRPPVDAALVGDVDSRELQAAAYASNIELEGIRQIIVVGQRNSRSTRR